MSSTLDFRGLQKQLSSNQPHPIYFFYGEDVYLKDEALKIVQQKTVSSDLKDFNVNFYSALNTDCYEVIDVIGTIPMMSNKRLVIYSDIEKLKKEDWKALENILENPITTCTLILVASKIDKRKKYFKDIAKRAVLVELKTPYDNQMPAWIDYISRQLGAEITPEACRVLHQLVGSQLLEIKCQLEKLISFAKNKKKIEVEDVLEVVPRLRLDSIFQLTEAIGRKDKSSARIYLANLLHYGQSEIGVLSMILRHIRILSDIHAGLEEGLSGQKLSARAGISNYFLRQYQQQLQFWNQKSFEQTIESLHQTDIALKSSPLSSHIWLENLIIQSCSFENKNTIDNY